MEPTGVHGGLLSDVSVPGVYHNALRLAAEESRQRPPALALETLCSLSTQLDAMQFAARFNNGGSDAEEQITLEGLAEQSAAALLAGGHGPPAKSSSHS